MVNKVRDTRNSSNGHEDEIYSSTLEKHKKYIENFDILETITNVGNDEVFTPRDVCDWMLDSLPKEVWTNKDYKWLNPSTKNGIFEREIALRLNIGLKKIIPNEEERKKHILQNMIFSIGQTRFTSYVARRTLYYCINANQKSDYKKSEDGYYVNGYAIGNGTWFATTEGNIKTPNKLNHVFDKVGKCKYCPIKEKSKYNNSDQLEKYAYEFLHIKQEEISDYLANRFFEGNKNMKFDIIIGNPPYQLNDGGGTGSSAVPIYHDFVLKALSLKPNYLSMIIPSRWMSGGRGGESMKKFKEEIMNSKNVFCLHDYPNSSICFPNNDIKGGVCFFVIQDGYNDKCKLIRYDENGKKEKEIFTFLKDLNFDNTLLRDEIQKTILTKVRSHTHTHTNNHLEWFSSKVSPRKPYGLSSDFLENPKKYDLPNSISNEPLVDGYKIYGLYNQERCWKYIKKDYPLPKKTDCLNKFKIFIAKAYGCGTIGEVPSTPVLSTPVLSTPGQLCTETFLEIGPFNSEEETKNCLAYIKTKFFRLLVGMKKNTQNTTQETYSFVPLLPFDKSYTDKELYKMFDLSEDEIDYIEENIEEME